MLPVNNGNDGQTAFVDNVNAIPVTPRRMAFVYQVKLLHRMSTAFKNGTYPKSPTVDFSIQIGLSFLNKLA